MRTKLSLLLPLLAIFLLAASFFGQADSKMSKTKTSGKTEIATLAGGCFWCTEADLEKLPDVIDVVSGYSIVSNFRCLFLRRACQDQSGLVGW